MVRPLAVACVAFSSFYTMMANAADDFRVETTVKVDAKKTKYDFLTIFRGTSVYDFSLANDEVTIFDTARDQVILADKDRKVKTIVRFDELREFSRTILERAKARGEKGVFDPNIDYRHVDTAELPYMAATNLLGYVAKGIQPPKENREAAARYRQFSDMAAMLSGMKPGGIPPFVRLRLNRGMFEDGVVPTHVRRTFVQAHLLRDNKIIVNAEHRFNWIISQKDAQRIDEVNSWLTECEAVSLRKYLDIGPVVASKPSASRK